MADMAALSKAVSALDLIVMFVRIFQRYQEYLETGHNIPKNLQNAANTIPYLRKQLENHAQVKKEALAGDNAAEMGVVFVSCKIGAFTISFEGIKNLNNVDEASVRKYTLSPIPLTQRRNPDSESL